MTGGADGAKRSSDGSPLPRDTWVGYAAVAWALAFAVMHLYWAFGGAWLVGEDAVEQSATLLARDPW